VWEAFAQDDLAGHSDEVRSVAYSPDGKHIVSGSTDATVRIWDAATGKEVSSGF
jgi:WD40 repeat protein